LVPSHFFGTMVTKFSNCSWRHGEELFNQQFRTCLALMNCELSSHSLNADNHHFFSFTDLDLLEDPIVEPGRRNNRLYGSLYAIEPEEIDSETSSKEYPIQNIISQTDQPVNQLKQPVNQLKQPVNQPNQSGSQQIQLISLSNKQVNQQHHQDNQQVNQLKHPVNQKKQPANQQHQDLQTCNKPQQKTISTKNTTPPEQQKNPNKTPKSQKKRRKNKKRKTSSSTSSTPSQPQKQASVSRQFANITNNPIQTKRKRDSIDYNTFNSDGIKKGGRSVK